MAAGSWTSRGKLGREFGLSFEEPARVSGKFVVRVERGVLLFMSDGGTFTLVGINRYRSVSLSFYYILFTAAFRARYL